MLYFICSLHVIGAVLLVFVRCKPVYDQNKYVYGLVTVEVLMVWLENISGCPQYNLHLVSTNFNHNATMHQGAVPPHEPNDMLFWTFWRVCLF